MYALTEKTDWETSAYFQQGHCANPCPFCVMRIGYALSDGDDSGIVESNVDDLIVGEGDRSEPRDAEADTRRSLDSGHGDRLGKVVAAFERPECETFYAHRLPVNIVSLDRSERRTLRCLEGARVGLISGIACPTSLRRTVEGLGAKVLRERRFRDHHVYERADVDHLDESVEMWLTTEKDAVKILPRWLGRTRLWVLIIIYPHYK